MNLLFSKPPNCYIVPSNRSFIGLSGEMNFPWTKFDACLISMQCHLVNWPKGVPIPLQCKEHVHLKAGTKTFGFRLLDNTEHLNILVRALAYSQEAEDAEGERSIIPNSWLSLEIWKNCKACSYCPHLSSLTVSLYSDDQKDVYLNDIGNSAAVIYLDGTTAIKFKDCATWLTDKMKAESKPAICSSRGTKPKRSDLVSKHDSTSTSLHQNSTLREQLWCLLYTCHILGALYLSRAEASRSD